MDKGQDSLRVLFWKSRVGYKVFILLACQVCVSVSESKRGRLVFWSCLRVALTWKPVFTCTTIMFSSPKPLAFICILLL